MTSHPPAKDQLPVYDGLVRELGDVVAEAREVAEQARDQAWQGLAGNPAAPGGPRQQRPAR